MNHFLKLGSYASIFMRSRNIKNSSWGIVGVMILVLLLISNYLNILKELYITILFPIDDLMQGVETDKRILTKEKIDRQLSGQSLSTPFMSIKDSHSRKVSFDAREELGDKIDKLAVMIGKLATRDRGSGRQFKPQIYQGKSRGQNRGNYDRCYYDQ